VTETLGLFLAASSIADLSHDRRPTFLAAMKQPLEQYFFWHFLSRDPHIMHDRRGLLFAVPESGGFRAFPSAFHSSRRSTDAAALQPSQ
jgi:hypothetical protein